MVLMYPVMVNGENQVILDSKIDGIQFGNTKYVNFRKGYDYTSINII